MGLNPFTKETTDECTIDVLLKLAEVQVGRISDPGARCYAALLLYERRWRELLDWLPSHASVADFLHIRQIQGFFQKFPGLPLGEDKRANAWLAFCEAESLCLETNLLLRAVNDGRACFADRRVEAWLFQAQRKISQVLGDLPTFHEVRPRFGPGACAGIPKQKASRKLKLSEQYSCSETFRPVLVSALCTVPAMAFTAARTGVLLANARLSFVPKNAKTLRAVATEPSLNTLFQLGYGDYMSERLGRFGVDLRDQTKNQRLAREGSLTGALATLDLTSASDTISRELVWSLLPFDWAERLDELRSPVLETPEGPVELEKFSSMGNGYTFPLESLIFWALCKAVCRSDAVVSVYGDDIIVPTEHFDDVVTLLRALGFIPNLAKSFSKGAFRESCGTDWLRGMDVRPFFFKGRVSPSRLFVAYNYFARQFDSETCQVILNFIPEKVRVWGPDGYGDGHLIGGQSSTRRIKRDRQYAGYVFESWLSIPKRDWTPRPGDALLPVYSVYLRKPVVPALRCISHRDLLRRIALEYQSIPSDETPQREYLSLNEDAVVSVLDHDDPRNAGTVFGDTLPGTERYRRISVYTLSP